MRMMRNGWMFIAVLALAGALMAQQTPRRNSPPGLPKPSGPSMQSGNQLVRVTATADVTEIVTGQKFHLAFIFDIEPQWHIYWRNPGNAGGGPTEIKVTAPPDYVIGKTLWPRPIAIASDEGMSYAYESRTVIFVEVTPPLQSNIQQAVFNARINWMVCKDVCLLGNNSQMITLPVGSGQPKRSMSPASSIDPAVKQFKARLPQPLGNLNGAEAKFNGNALSITMPAQGHNRAEFFPIEAPGVQYDEPMISAENDVVTVTVPVHINPSNAMGKPMSVRGSVGLGTSQSEPSYDVEIPVSAP